MDMPTILVAEDELVVAMDLCETIAEAGCEIEGPFGDITSAMLAVQKKRPDLAILDVRLRDGESYALAEKLISEDVPVIFHSGHFTVTEMNERFPGAVACAKPCPPNQLIEKMQQALAH